MIPASLSLSRALAFSLLALSLTCCEVGPDYTTSETSLPQAWVSKDIPEISAKTEIDEEWWKNFNDPVLTKLIDKAVADNLDLKIAEARLAAARASVAAAGASLLPSGDLKGSAMREANQMALPGGGGATFGPLLHKPFNLYETGFDASWELDLFGGNRRGEEAAGALMQASEATRDDVQVSLLAEVARTYVDIREAEAELEIARNVVTSDQKTHQLAEQRFNSGLSPRLEVTDAEAALEQASGHIPELRNNLAEAEYKLDVLLGEQPGFSHRLVGESVFIPVSGKKLILTAPSSVIAQRPDIRNAERRLAAATAQQGAALAKFFPDISLTGFFGALNTSTSKLLTGANQSWLAGGSVLWPILSYGTLSANLDSANAQQQEALVTYQKTVISALSDIERALTAYEEKQKVEQSIQKQVEKNQRSRAVAEERYREGLTSLREVLDADRVLFTTEDTLSQARANETEALIAVYKSLGGGWAKKPVLKK